MDKHPAGPAETYHTATSYTRNRMDGHFLDWAGQPLPYKDYGRAVTQPLPTDLSFPDVSMAAVAAVNGEPEIDPKPLDRHRMATLCALTHRFTAQRQVQGQTFFYRNVASAGALYPAELYVAANRVVGLDTGVYYYDIREFALKSLRSDVDRKAFPDAGRRAVATFIVTGIFFRSAWKYRARALRYVLLDAGHLLESLRNALRCLGLPFRIDYDFDDRAINRLAGLNPSREAAWACVSVQAEPAVAEPAVRDENDSKVSSLAPLAADKRDAEKPIIYPEIETLVNASMVVPEGPTARVGDVQVTTQPVGQWIELPSFQPNRSDLSYYQALVQRRSKRNFIDRPVSDQKAFNLMQLLVSAMRSGKACTAGLAAGFLSGNVTNLAAGFYLLDATRQRYGCVRKGQYVQPMASVCLDQQWLKNAGLHFVFMVNLRALDQGWGARGYRYAMLEAGRLGQCLYLGASAMGLGCCGIGALYDEDARSLLRLNAESALLYLVAVGQVRR